MGISTITSHPQRQRIIDALVAEQPYRIIQSWAEPKVSTGALSRFKRSAIAELSGAVRQSVERHAGQASVERIYDTDGRSTAPAVVQRAALSAVTSPFRGQLDRLRDITFTAIERAQSAVRVTTDKDGNQVVVGPDIAAIAPLLGQGHRNAELLGRATGELTDSQGAGSPVVNLAVCLNVPRD
jgi:hypothetical protein